MLWVFFGPMFVYRQNCVRAYGFIFVSLLSDCRAQSSMASFGNDLKVCIEGLIFSRLRTDLSSSHITRIFLPTRYNNLEDNG